MTRANRMVLRGLYAAYREAVNRNGPASQRAASWRATVRSYIRSGSLNP